MYEESKVRCSRCGFKIPDKGNVFCYTCLEEARVKIVELQEKMKSLETELELAITIGENLKEEINGIQRL